ncbi:MAG: hypothetical protein P8N02_00450 [Actinomycetota bacterium]|nr:hypothetical protein [Actinomycetota bacterium]
MTTNATTLWHTRHARADNDAAAIGSLISDDVVWAPPVGAGMGTFEEREMDEYADTLHAFEQMGLLDS